jgi:two-component system, cell cycle sensor histidine kinase and response regulator CckA
MVYGIIKNHLGYIDVRSEPGLSTAFELFLPESRLPEEKRTVSYPKKQKQGKRTVLLVDDEEMIRNVIRKILETNGYSVLIAKDGYEAQKLLAANREEVDVIILDLILPLLSGKETFRILHGIDHTIPIIISSGFSIDDDSQEMLNSGAFDFLQKPYDLAKLLHTIKSAITR